MHRLLLDSIEGDTVILAGERHHRATRVLRLRRGDRLRVFDGQGREYEAIIEAAGRGQATLRLEKAVQPIPEPAIRIILFQSIPRGDAMERVIQKAVEIGVSEVIPVITRRTVARTPGGGGSKLARWRKIALHAVEQSGRAWLVPVAEPMHAGEVTCRLAATDLVVLPHITAAAAGHRGDVILSKAKNLPRAQRHPERTARSETLGEPIGAVLRSIQRPTSLAIVIGPEGGFAPDEVERLAAAGARVVSLGPRVLRAETAGLVAAAIVLYHFGEMG